MTDREDGSAAATSALPGMHRAGLGAWFCACASSSPGIHLLASSPVVNAGIKPNAPPVDAALGQRASGRPVWPGPVRLAGYAELLRRAGRQSRPSCGARMPKRDSCVPSCSFRRSARCRRSA